MGVWDIGLMGGSRPLNLWRRDIFQNFLNTSRIKALPFSLYILSQSQITIATVPKKKVSSSKL